MAFSAHVRNPIPQLVELHCHVVEANQPGAADVHVSVMVQPDEIDVEQYTLEISMRRAFICVEPHGCQTEHHSKYGLRKVAPVEERKDTVELSTMVALNETAAVEAIAGLSADLSKIGGHADVAASRAATRSKEVKAARTGDRIYRHLNVEAIGGDRWQLCADGETSLKGSYVEERLCRLLKSQELTNRYGATITAEVRKRDIDVRLIADRRPFSFKEPNKEKFLKLMVAVHLSGEPQGPSGDHIKFASVEVNDEG